LELWLFQQLSSQDLASLTTLDSLAGATGDRSPPSLQQAWVKIERILRQYIQHHLGKSIRSAALLLVGQ
jgi:DNA repair protein RecO (recombination protein O)